MATEIKTVKSITLVTPVVGGDTTVNNITILRLNVKLAHSEESLFVYVAKSTADAAMDHVKEWLSGESIFKGFSNFHQRSHPEGNEIFLTYSILFGIDAGKTAQVEIVQVYKFKVGD